jgi:hypothetical protein
MKSSASYPTSIKDKLFGNIFVLCLYSLWVVCVASEMLQYNHGYITFVVAKHSSKLLDSRGIRDT